MKNGSPHIRRLVLSAFFAALTCVSTLLHIPTALGGYIHPGDAFVLLGAFLLGSWWGGGAAAIGSVLAELLSGSLIYAPGTFVIKFLMVLIAATPLRRGNRPIVATIFGGILAELFMVCGYFAYNAWIIRYGMVAVAGLVTDFMQAVFGVVVSTILYTAICKRIDLHP